MKFVAITEEEKKASHGLRLLLVRIIRDGLIGAMAEVAIFTQITTRRVLLPTVLIKVRMVRLRGKLAVGTVEGKLSHHQWHQPSHQLNQSPTEGNDGGGKSLRHKTTTSFIPKNAIMFHSSFYLSSLPRRELLLSYICLLLRTTTLQILISRDSTECTSATTESVIWSPCVAKCLVINGLDLAVHIRITSVEIHSAAYSYISSMAMQIGSYILGVSGDDDELIMNGLKGQEVDQGDSITVLAGHTITTSSHGAQNRIIILMTAKGCSEPELTTRRGWLLISRWIHGCDRTVELLWRGLASQVLIGAAGREGEAMSFREAHAR